MCAPMGAAMWRRYVAPLCWRRYVGAAVWRRCVVWDAAVAFGAPLLRRYVAPLFDAAVRRHCSAPLFGA